MKNNLLLKFIVLLFAILLWYQLVLVKEQTVVLDIPAKLINLDSDLIYDENSNSEIEIKIKANGMDLLFLKLADAYLEIDAKNLKYGKNFIKLSAAMFQYPERLALEILNIENSQRHVISIDRIVTAFKPIKITFATPKDEEYFISNKLLSDEKRIAVSGAQSVVDSLQFIATEPASRKSVKDGKISLKLIAQDDNITIEKDNINLEISRSETAIRTISLIPISYSESDNITIIPQKVSVMVSGPKEIINNLNLRSIKAELDYNNLLNSKNAKVNFELPPGVNLLEYTPNKIQVLENE
ncbi:MAG: CdaR family protein [Candidatus Cloacimonadales bacterium]